MGESVDVSENVKFSTIFGLTSGQSFPVLSVGEHPSSYSVISHVWGNIKKFDDQTNKINDGITVASSMAKLKALQSVIRSRSAIWCDVYCINQNDINDKCAQVSIMDKIYDNCSECIILLDPKDGEALRKTSADHLAIVDVLEGLVKRIESDTCDDEFVQKSARKAVNLSKIADRVRYERDTESVQINYFKRGWTLQEIVYPRKFEVFTYSTDDAEGTLIPIPDFERLINFAKQSESWWYNYIFPNTVRNPEACGITIKQANALRHLSWALINSKLFRSLKGAGIGSYEMENVDMMVRADNYIYNNTRTVSVSHDLIYSIMKLAGTTINVDYSQPFREVLAEFTIQCIRKGQMHVSHFISHREGVVLDANEWFNIDGQSWMGSALAIGDEQMKTMKLLNRRWVDDMPEKRLPLPTIETLSDDLSTLIVRAAMPVQSVSDDSGSEDSKDDMMARLEQETDHLTGIRMSEIPHKFYKRQLGEDFEIYEVVSVEDSRLLFTYMYDCNNILSRGSVGYSRNPWSETDRLVRVGRSFLYLSEDLRSVKNRTHLQTFHQAPLSLALIKWIKLAFGDENTDLCLDK
ncbi:WD repeat-containing protein jip5 [Nowakowskiella sp. JEL0078]|nr:WD repeat-containing protein jip5 [Nowakowskiella sp. JEL0078]